MSASDQEKKILIFSATYEPFSGKAELAIKEITDRLPENDYYLLCNKLEAHWPSEEKIGNINVRCLGKGRKWDKYLYPLRAAAYATVLHKNIKFDFVWSIRAQQAGLAALFFKYKTKVPYLLTLPSGGNENFTKKHIWLLNPLRKQIYRQAKLTQALSRRLGKQARDMGNHGEVILLPSGADLDVFKNSLTYEYKQALRKELGIYQDETVIIGGLRLVLKKGIDDLIKAINFLVYKLGIRAKLIILGSYADENKLRQLAKEQGVEDKVLFVSYADYNQLPPYLEMADIFCGPSFAEGFGAYFLEAMALGIPIIATRPGGIPDFLIDGETGLFCEAGNPASIALAVEKLVKDKELYDKIASAGRDLVSKKYSWAIISQQMKQMFNKMVE